MAEDVSDEAQGAMAANAEESPERGGHPIVVALRDVTTGSLNLFKHNLELAKYEAKSDAVELGKDAAAIVAAGLFAFFGYALLNLSAIAFSAWFGGIVAMGVVTLALALIHLIGGGVLVRAALKHFRQRHYGLIYTEKEVERSQAWAKETIEKVKRGEEVSDPMTRETPPSSGETTSTR